MSLSNKGRKKLVTMVMVTKLEVVRMKRILKEYYGISTHVGLWCFIANYKS